MVGALICPSCGNAFADGDTFCGTCGSLVTPVPAADGTAIGVHLTGTDDLVLEKLRELTAGEYEVRDLLGRGGMASVFVAYDLTLNRKVALKAMHPGLLGDAGMRERFRLEARLAARLDHPNIVTVHAVKERGAIVFFDLKLIEGTSLDRMVRHRGGPFPVDVARWLTATIADALHYAHGEGVVHRDVKPANVMVDRRGDPTVTDFGIAKANESPNLTLTGAVVGTPAYMSPEQCLGNDITAASDQYSLGILAYELLTGAVPFTGTMLTIQLGHVEHAPAPPHLVNKEVPIAVSNVVMRMIAKDPVARWPTLALAADALLEDLGATQARIRASLASLVAALPRDVLPAFPPTPHSPTPATIGPGAAKSSAVADARVRNAATQKMDVTPSAPRPALAPTPIVSMEAIERERTRRRFLQLGGIAAVGIGIVAIIAVATGGRSDATDTPVAAAVQVALPALSSPAAPDPASSAVDSATALDASLDVSDSTVVRVGLTPVTVTLSAGDSVWLKATAYGPSGESIARRIRWSSGDTLVARVGAGGWVFGVARGGPVFITASTARRSGVAVVTVR